MTNLNENLRILEQKMETLMQETEIMADNAERTNEMACLMMDSLSRIAMGQCEDPRMDALNTIRGLQRLVPDENLPPCRS
jgi:hypothetical protein